MARILAIGDVHGCAQVLSDLLELLKVNQQDHVIFLGDLINRGPDTPGVLNIIRNLQAKKTLILGNHEDRLLQYHATGNESILKVVDLPTLKILKDEDWRLLKTMVPNYYAKEYNTVFVHGGFVPGIPWYEQPKETVCQVQVVQPNGKWGMRDDYPDYPFWADLWHGPPFVIYGHTPRKNPERHAWSLGIDTNCVLGGSLTAYILPEKKIVQVPSKRRPSKNEVC